MKMLSEEGTQVNLSPSIVRELMESQPGQSREFLHHQICQELDGYHSVDSFSAPQSHSVYLQVILQPSPELLYGVMLLPYRQDLTCSQLPAKSHNTLHHRAILKQQQDHLPKGWAFCCSSGYWYAFASPDMILQLYFLLMQAQLLALSIYTEDIVTLGVNQYLVESSFLQHIHQVFGAIGTIEGDGEQSQIHPFVSEEVQHLMKHFPEYLWLGCVRSTLLPHRSYAQGDYPVIHLDGYSDDVLTTHHLLVLATEPTVSKSYDSTQPVYDCVINADGNTRSGESCWTHGKPFSYQPDCFLTSSNQEHSPEQIDTPGLDGSIYLVLVYTQSLSHLVRSEYLEDMTNSQHQHYLNGFLLAVSEPAVKKLLKWLEKSGNLILHFSLLVGVLAFSYAQPIRRLSFSSIVKAFVMFS